jgi:hypothetical protein
MYVLVMHGSIVFSVVAATVILGVQGTLDSSSVLGILGAAIGFAGGTAASTASLGAAVNGKSVISAGEMANREATLRTAIVASAATEPHTIEPLQPEPAPFEE